MRLECGARVLCALSAVFFCALALLSSFQVAHAEDVEITSDVTTGVNLDSASGTTAKIFSGVTVSNTNVAVPAVSATTQAWTLTNDGTIGPTVFGDGVRLDMGGTVINSGSIDGFNGIWLGQGPGTVNNLDGATIHGSAGAVVCGFIGSCAGAVDVTNAGDITSDSADAVALSAGGTVTNYAGGLIQSDGSNAVSILFGTAREVTNSGTILSTAAFAAGVSIDGGMVTNNAGGEITGAFNGIWAHTAGGPTTVINDGLIEATAADFAFGVPGSAVELDSGGTIANTGTIRSSSTNSTDAAIYSAGATTVTSSGTIASLTGGKAIQFAGGALHTLKLDTGSVLGGNVQGGTGTDALVMLGDGAENIAKFLSFETLSMQGDAWTLTGSGAFTTSSAVESGRLAVNGTLTTPALTVESGATLAGDGTIVGAVTVDGTLAPGNSIGTLSTGSIGFNSGSIFEVEVAADGTGDLIDVTGTATIEGGTASVLTLDPHTAYTDGQAWVIIDTTAGVTANGAGFAVTDDSAFLDFALTYDPFQVILTLSRVADFQSVAETFNQRQAAAALQQLDQTSGSDALAVFNALSLLDPDEARAAFDMASGEIHASLQHTMLDISDLFVTTLARRAGLAVAVGGAGVALAPLAYASPGDALAQMPADQRLAAWVAPMGEVAARDGDGNAATLDHRVVGVAAGLDWRGRWLGVDGIAGIAAAYTHAEADVDDRRSTASFDSGHVGLYAGLDAERLRLAGAAAYAFHAIDTTRGIVFPSVDRVSRGAFDGHTLSLHGEAAYRLPVSQLTFAPLVTGDVLLGWKGAASESGAGALSLGVASEEIERYTAGLGFALSRRWASGPSLVDAELRLLWEHAFGDDRPEQDLVLAGAPAAPFTVLGPTRAADWLKAGIGVGIALDGGGSLTARYDGAFATTGSTHQAHLSLAYPL